MGDKLSEVATGLADVAVKLNDSATTISNGDIDLTEERTRVAALLTNAADALNGLSATCQAVAEALAGPAEAPAAEEAPSE
jgi:hypothetical protein